ncbi:MAG: hypothetical protein JNM98_18535 [Rhodocyclaceae bacterium]|nr:hypothetical protein [Rhodocyclaceae bacterium]
MTRNIVKNHPNTFTCQVFRKEVTRPDAATLGGLGVLDTADEEQFEYVFMGNGCALPADQFAPAPMVSHGDANIGSGEEFRFLIEPEEPPGQPEWFDIRTHDVVYLLMGAGPSAAKLAFEVVGTETTSNIPPFTTRYITNRRDDLHVAAA